MDLDTESLGLDWKSGIGEGHLSSQGEEEEEGLDWKVLVGLGLWLDSLAVVVEIVRRE